MRFRGLISVLIFLILGSYSKNFAQDSNTVFYRIYMEKKLSSYYTAKEKISSGIFKEGKGFRIPPSVLPDSYPADFSMFQNLYNALVGGYFSIDYGAINSNLLLELFIRNLDPDTGKYKPQGEDGDTLFAYFEIRITELPDSVKDPDDLDLSQLPDSSYFPVDSSYYFNKGKYARLSLPKTEYFLNFLDSIGISRNDSLSFAYMQYEDWDSNGTKTNDWNGNGIEVTDTPDSIIFKAIHLSKVGGGRGRIHKRRFDYQTSIEKIPGLPDKFNLEQNYPNPFNPTTTIRYKLSSNERGETREVKLVVYNILGEKVRTLVNKKQKAGIYEVSFDASDLTSGIYIYTLRSNNLIQTRKMILLK